MRQLKQLPVSKGQLEVLQRDLSANMEIPNKKFAICLLRNMETVAKHLDEYQKSIKIDVTDEISEYFKKEKELMSKHMLMGEDGKPMVNPDKSFIFKDQALYTQENKALQEANPEVVAKLEAHKQAVIKIQGETVLVSIEMIPVEELPETMTASEIDQIGFLIANYGQLLNVGEPLQSAEAKLAKVD